MGSKSISITDEVYNLLKQFQLKEENFSQTILRLLIKQENLLGLAGAWKKIPNSEEAIEIIESTVDKARNEPNKPIHNLSNIQRILSSYGAAKSEDLEHEKFVIESYAKTRKLIRKSFNARFN